MGLFAARPEEPTEWAGLPSEPLTADSLGSLLPDSAATDAGGLFGIAPVESIAISVPLTALVASVDDRASTESSAASDTHGDAGN